MITFSCALFLLAGVAQDTQVMTAVPNVRLRTAPSVESEIIREEPLGAVHNVKERTADGWLRVDFGYVREELTRPFSPAARAAVVEGVILGQLERQDAGFEAWNQLLLLTDMRGAREDDRETAARFALYDLKALRGAADAAGGMFRTRFAHRLAADSRVFVNHEPAGQWILRREHILDVHERFRGTAAADDIAWFAAENGFPGECEGEPGCHAFVSDELHGWYLRAYPAGRHADRALEAIKVWMFYGTLAPEQVEEYRLDCDELRRRTSALREAVTATASSRREPALQAIEKFSAMCR